MEQVKTCRVCHSNDIIDLKLEKPFYLLNMDKTITLPYAACQDCQFIFQSEYVGDEFLNNYYKNSLMLRRDHLTDIIATQDHQQADFMSRSVSLFGKRVLEIGADTGNLLKQLKYAYNCDVYFDELSLDARKMLIDAGIKNIEDVGEEVKMDVIVMRHLLEHIFDLKEFLKGVRSRLKDDGILYIEVPDWSYMDEHTDPFMFEHLNQFSSYNLNLLLKLNGFVVDEQEKNVNELFYSTPYRVLRVIARPCQLAPLRDPKIKDNFHYCYEHFMCIFGALNKRLESLGDDVEIGLYPASTLTFDALSGSELTQKNVIGMFDVDTRKHGKSFMDISIYPPEKLKELQPDIIFLLTVGAFKDEIIADIRSHGFQGEIITWGELAEDNLAPDA